MDIERKSLAGFMAGTDRTSDGKLEEFEDNLTRRANISQSVDKSGGIDNFSKEGEKDPY